MKKNKTISVEMEVFDHLSKQPNASVYIEDLVYSDINREKAKKPKEIVDLSTTVTETEADFIEKLKKEQDKKNRSTAWDNLDVEVREEIKDMEGWGKKWHEIFYPMWKEKGNLTLKDVRDWYFANKEGFKL